MTEGLADEYNRASESHVRLYRSWSRNSIVLITGNIQIDRRYLERSGNVVIDGPQSPEQLERLRAWASAAQENGSQLWAQLSHAGRQTDALVNREPVGPSAIPYKPLQGRASVPRAMTTEDIADVVQRFAHAAATVQACGFAGVQLHSAHGYLLSSFLNPKANQRQDAYGGSVANRARLLLQVVAAVRAKVGPAFPVTVKLNSSDFQKGGFDPAEAVKVAVLLQDAGVDLLEVSGGNYEQPSFMFGPKGFEDMQKLQQLGKITSSQLREGYFMVFSEQIKAAIKHMPVMVTGGFRSQEAMEQCLSKGAADVVGIARPLADDPSCVGMLLSGQITSLPRAEETLDLPWGLRWTRRLILGQLVRAGGIVRYFDYRIQVSGGVAEDKPRSLLFLFKWGPKEQLAKAKALKDMPCVGTVVGTRSIA